MQIKKKSHFPLIFHFTHSKERNQLCVPVKLPDMGSQRCNKCMWNLWEFLCDKLQEPPLTAKSVFPVCIGEVLVSTQNEFWLANLIYECRRGCVCVCVRARKCGCTSPPHVTAGTRLRLAAFRSAEGVSFIQLPPRYLSSPSAPVPFSLFGFEEKWHLWDKLSSQLCVHMSV